MAKSGVKYFKHLDLLRIIACISIFLFHLGLIKGGYLAVCLFFTLSGYLGCIKNYRKNIFNILEYYKGKILNIYVPMVMVLLVTVYISKFFQDIAWLNLKLEVKSVLLNYNNFWQISTNVDYFTKSINSPLTHLWYISMLIQYELVFPFIFILFKKIGKSVSKGLSVFLLTLISVFLAVYFAHVTVSKGIMISYYDTFARAYSYMFGITLGFIHVFFGIPIKKRFRIRPLLMLFYIILTGVLVYMFMSIDSSSNLFIFAMIATSVITLRLIDYSIIINNSFCRPIVKYLASISYEVYLIQYPVIYYVTVNNYPNKYLLIVSITLIASIILGFIFNRNFKGRLVKIIKFLLVAVMLIFVVMGARIFALESDNVEEMKRLEEQLKQNEELINVSNEEQMKSLQQEDENWEKELEKLTNSSDGLGEYITSMKITGIGDSVLLGAVPGLYKKFPNGYFDGKVSRTDCQLPGLLDEINNNGKLYDTVIMNLGTNGSCKNTDVIMEKLKDKKVYWLSIVNDYQVPKVAKDIYDYPNRYPNVKIIDWKNISKDHTEYFYKDGIHLTSSGITGYVNAIYETLYNDYKSEYDLKIQELQKKHDEELKKRITFIGNSSLISVYPKLNEDIKSTNIITNKDYDFETLVSDIEKAKTDKKLNHRLVFVLDNTFKVSKQKIDELFKTLDGYEITFVSFTSSIDKLDNAKVLNFYDELKDKNMLHKDKVHLSDQGIERLKTILINYLNE